MMILRKSLVVQFVIIVFLVMNIGVNTVPGYSNNGFEEKRVLFISSYSPSFPTYFNQIDGIVDTFDEYPIILDIEFMDSKRYYTPENIENFKTSLTYKLNEVSYDLVMTSDDNAATFVMDNREELFDGLPIIFFGVNNESNAQTYSQQQGVTGVVESVSMEETLQLALTLNPQADNIVALVDNTITGQSELSSFLELQSAFPGIQLDSINLGQMTLNEFLVDISKIGEDSVILLISALRDVNDASYEFHEVNDLILDFATQPVYHLYEFGIEDGLIGGKVVSHYHQAEIAAQMAIDYFNGEDVDNLLLVEESPNIYVINYEVFESYNFSDSLLPESVVFINKELSVFEQYRSYILSAGLFLVIQSLIISALIVNVRNRKKTQLKLIDSNVALEQANDQLVYKSYHDDLTGLFNRNYFEEQFPRITKLDETVPVSVVLIDVNGLKLINDAFGHINGDKVLVQTSKLLLEIFVDSDIFRIGGDEFAVIPYGKDEKTLSSIINTLNQRMSEIDIEGITVSVSVGYAFYEESKSVSDMFTEAEDWMYREKLNHVPSNRSATINTIIATIHQKDKYSEQHSQRVSELSVKIATYLDAGDNLISEIKTAGLLHDIGKIIVPTHILNKNGKLTDKEYEEIKKHSEIGYRILNSVASMRSIAETVFCHHERIDGTGYPRGLKKEEIPFQSRIIAVADALDAMLTDRLYRDRLSVEECKEQLMKYKGTQFCSIVVNSVIENFDDILHVFEQ